jgi:hypothetical protein
VTLVEEELPGDYFSFAAWLSRQQTRPRGAQTPSFGELRARWERWYAEAYPKSAPGRAAAERLAAVDASRKIAPAKTDVTRPVTGTARAALIADSLEDLAELVGELLLNVAPERQPRLRRVLHQVDKRIDELRASFPLFTPNGGPS